jgi:hypothetical protein
MGGIAVIEDFQKIAALAIIQGLSQKTENKAR